jgi:hypothetical protein
MFSVDMSKKELQEFSTNRLILKFNKEALVEKAVEPKSVKNATQSISPNEPLGFEHVFEVY